MIFTTRCMQVSLLSPKLPMEEFIHHQLKDGGKEDYKRQNYFIRYIGQQERKEELLEMIAFLDQQFKGQSHYLRLRQLEKPVDPIKVQAYGRLYDAWEQSNKDNLQEQYTLSFPFQFKNPMMELTQKVSFTKIMYLFQKVHSGANATIRKNMGVILLSLTERYFSELFKEEEIICPKVVYTGEVKRQELFFLYYLHLMGCDVLYMDFTDLLKQKYPECQEISTAYKPPHVKHFTRNTPPKEKNQTVSSEQLHEPDPQSLFRICEESKEESQPLSYEALAAQAISVVMIKCLDEDGRVAGVGSGVVISEMGYIITNCHVVRKGYTYQVKFEEDNNVYETSRIIKYHTVFDLAIIKVERKCQPLKVYQGKKLTRGQQIVAIGSPCGLFNSISDGIVAGFREEKSGVGFIQFTAPISTGSSGGALLDLHGRLIGIVTMSANEGQNLNLAVSYEYIHYIAGNYIKR